MIIHGDGNMSSRGSRRYRREDGGVWTKTRIEDKSEPAPVNIWAPTDDRGQRNLGTEACGGFFLQKLVHVGASFGRAYAHLRACISPATTVICVKWTPTPHHYLFD
jgi:hypothetical protein